MGARLAVCLDHISIKRKPWARRERFITASPSVLERRKTIWEVKNGTEIRVDWDNQTQKSLMTLKMPMN